MPYAYYIDPILKRGRNIRPGDDLDMAKAVLLCVAKHAISTNQTTYNRLRMLRKNNDELWNTEARQLLRQAQVPERTPYTMEDLVKLATCFPAYKFVVYGRTVPNKIYGIEFVTGNEHGIVLNLMVFQNKWDWFSVSEISIGKTICPLCGYGYTHQYQHRCIQACKKCRFEKLKCSEAQDENITCDDCNQTFGSTICYENHKKSPRGKVSPACKVFKICSECKIFYTPRNGIHVCYEQTFCKTCETKIVVGRHECTWPPTTPEKRQKLLKKSGTFRIIVYDCECIQTSIATDTTSYGTHFVNMLAWSIFCNQCYTQDVDTPTSCDGCGPNRRGSYYNMDPTKPRLVADLFVDFLLTNKRLDNCICVAHNGSGYDHHLLIPSICALGIAPVIVRNGMKLILMEIPKLSDYPHFNTIKFKCFLLFSPLRLSELSRAYMFEDKLAKTYFPYLYNHYDNAGTTLSRLPKRKFYGISSMKPKDYEKFSKWYKENKHLPFSLDSEIKKYCINDTLVLHQAVCRYIQASIEMTGFSPLSVACTYASFSFFLIRNLHMTKGQVGIINEDGYFTHERQSKLAIKMIQWIEWTENIPIQYHLREGEFKITTRDGRKIRVDGYHAPTNTILGCYWHGCLSCVKPDTQHSSSYKLASQVYKETMARCWWEHDINIAVRTNPEMKKFFDSVLHTSRLKIREGFAGGRTQNYRLKAKAEPGRKIVHLDCVSMYPYILMNYSLPEGQPKVITSDLENITLPLKYKGFYKVDIIPAQVRYPILWMKWQSKLLFPTCGSCVKLGSKTPCEHSDSDRKIHITCTDMELTYGLEQGARVVKCYEVYHFRRFGTSLFRPFLTQFIAAKIEASGWAPNLTEEEKHQIVADYRNQGIIIRPEKVVKNESARTIAKLAINSAWGKFCERSRKPKSLLFNPEDEFPAILNDPTVQLNGLCLVENMMLATYTHVEEYVRPLKGTNVAIAAYCTAIGRILLTKNLERVGDRAIYCGPKVYSYIKRKIGTDEQEEICKVRGIVLDRGAAVINYSSMNHLVDQLFSGAPPIPLISTRPQITKKLGKIETRTITKKLNPVMNKMLFNGEPYFETRPIGWKKGIDSFFNLPNEPTSRSPSPLVLPSIWRGDSESPEAADAPGTPDSVRVRFYTSTPRDGSPRLQEADLETHFGIDDRVRAPDWKELFGDISDSE